MTIDFILSLVMVAPTSVAVPVAQKCGCRVRLCVSGIIHRRVITPGVIWGSRHTPLVTLVASRSGVAIQDPTELI